MMKRSQFARPCRQLLLCATAALALTGLAFAQTANTGSSAKPAAASTTDDEGGYSTWDVSPYVGWQFFQAFQGLNNTNFIDRFGSGWVFGERFTWDFAPKVAFEASMNVGSNRFYMEPAGSTSYSSIKSKNSQFAVDLVYHFQPRTAATRFFVLLGPAMELYTPGSTHGPSAEGTFVQPQFPPQRKIEPALSYGIGLKHNISEHYGVRFDLDGRFGPATHFGLPGGPSGPNTLYVPLKGYDSSLTASVGLELRMHYIPLETCATNPNKAGCVQAQTATIRVDAPSAGGAAPMITGAHDVCPGDDLRLTVNANGFPNPTYAWRVNGTAAAGTTNSFSAPTATGTGARAVTVVVTGGASVATSAAYTTAPMNTYHLTADVQGLAGRTAAYQWMANGQPIAGATSASVDLPNDAAKSITDRVTVPSAGVTSAPANYTIRALTPPTLTFAVSPTTVPFTSGPINLAAVATASQCGGAVTVRYSGEAVTGSTFNPGRVSGFDMGNRVRLQTHPVTITATATDAKGQTVTRTANVNVTLNPEAKRLKDIVFQSMSSRINNCGKRLLLDELAPMIKADPNGKVILIGHRSDKEKNAKKLDEERVLNAAAILSAGKGKTGKGVCEDLKLDHVMMKLAGTDQTSTQMPSFCGGSVKEKSIGIVKETDKDAPARRVEIWFVPSTAADPAGVSGATAVNAKAVAKLGCPK